MAITYRIANEIVLFEGDEEGSFEEWRRAVDGARINPRYRKGMGVVHDWRKRGSALSSAEVQRRVDYLTGIKDCLGPTRWALVVEREVDFGMGRMAEALLANSPLIEVRVFRSFSEAVIWARREPSGRAGGHVMPGPRGRDVGAAAEHRLD